MCAYSAHRSKVIKAIQKLTSFYFVGRSCEAHGVDEPPLILGNQVIEINNLQVLLTHGNWLTETNILAQVRSNLPRELEFLRQYIK